MTQFKHPKSEVQYIYISNDEAGQRIDNFLITRLKGLPKSRIYRILRKGEVRVNKKRINAFYKLQPKDHVRIPPVYLEEKGASAPPSKDTAALLTSRIIYEDEFFLVLNKPAGMSVHGGSTVRMGIIEILKYMYPKLPQLELAHRLDSETSGCLVLAKKKRILREVHQLLREGSITKIYTTLTKGHWQKEELKVDVSLQKNYKDGGKHVVEVDKEGKTALTHFKTVKIYESASLMEVELFTGRTHQIRVHAQHMGHPIAGDDRYGDADFNKLVKSFGLKNRMFLHASKIEFTLPSSGEVISVTAPLDAELRLFLDELPG